MNHFSSAHEAKDFLVSNIVAEAQREKVPLSEKERTMLYFSETAWTLPDIMEVNDEFDREYDQAEYEKKIAHLIRNAANRARKENPEEFATWLSAPFVSCRKRTTTSLSWLTWPACRCIRISTMSADCTNGFMAAWEVS